MQFCVGVVVVEVGVAYRACCNPLLCDKGIAHHFMMSYKKGIYSLTR